MTPFARRSLPAAVFTAAALAALSGCVTPHDLAANPPDGVPSPTATASVDIRDDAHFLVLRTDEGELRVGSMPEAEMFETAPMDLPAIAADEVYVFVPPAGWTFSAEQLQDVPNGCGPRVHEPEVAELGDGWFKVTPVGEPGAYTLRLSAGSGPGLPPGGEQGMVATYLDWTTTTGTGPVQPGAAIDFYLYPDYPGSVSIDVSNMSATPAEAEAIATVTGADGAERTLTFAVPDDDNCVQPGDLRLVADVSEEDTAALGQEDYSYEITMILDGTTYTAKGETEFANEGLEFAPALP